MKKLLFLSIAITLVFNACKKDNSKKTTTPKSTVLLSKIIDNTTTDGAYGQTLYEFTYNGTQLSKAVFYVYGYNSSGFSANLEEVDTHLFTYDSNGHLTGTTISSTVSNPSAVVSATFAYTGDNISDMKFYQPGNVLAMDIGLTYQNGNIATIAYKKTSPLYSYAYTYDSAGNNISIQDDEGDAPQTFTKFDTKPSLYLAFPVWAYFSYFLGGSFLEPPIGVNNPLTTYTDGDGGYVNVPFSYQYNSYGYPSTMSFTVPGSGSALQSYSYQYIQVN